MTLDTTATTPSDTFGRHANANTNSRSSVITNSTLGNRSIQLNVFKPDSTLLPVPPVPNHLVHVDQHKSNLKVPPVPWTKRIFRPATYSRRQPPYDLVCSPWLQPRTLLAVRIVLALWTLTWTIVSFAPPINIHGLAALSYFTTLSYCGLCALSLLLAFVSFKYYSNPRSTHLASRSTLRMVVSILYAQAFTYAFIVVGVYWGFLARIIRVKRNDPFFNLFNLSVHGLNLAVIFIHFLTSSLVVATWWLLVPVVVTGFLYLGWAVMWFFIRGFWVYPFLSPSNPSSAYMYPLVMLSFFVSFVVVYYLHRARRAFLGDSPVHKEVQALLSPSQLAFHRVAVPAAWSIKTNNPRYQLICL
ncbi:hypothetical protein BCR44DRAFT_1504929 [Catenaria anguillulae PL171]|uniref:Uncharacterized protein n=1 Tax=Catenaria anguillulae PL171 TaxID=765915 RepID=A0A1Y2H5C5_9FUNG|nr:hypothetical protein BCR44DRAFT_1504929 [Catenaria anguillulae PL171]